MNNRYLSSIAVGLILFQAHHAWAQNVGVGEPNPSQKLHVDGAIRIGNTVTANAGAIRYTGSDFQGYHGGQWVSLMTPTGLLSETLLSGRIFVGNASNVATGVPMSGDATIANTGALTIASGSVTSAKIADGTIVDADVAGAAAIARTKLASGTANRLLVNDGSGVMSQLAAGTDGFYLQLVAGAPAWVDAGSGFIRNQNTLQTSSNFYISNVGRTDGSFQSPIYTRADAGTVALRPNTNSVTAIQLQNAAGTSILNVNTSNSRVGIGNVAPDAALEVTGDVMLSKGGVRVISMERPDAGVGADSLVISGASAVVGSSARGGSLVLKAGDAYTGFSAPSGDVYLISGGNTFSNAGATRGDIVFSTGGVSDLGVPAPAIERMRIRNAGTIVSKRDIYIDDNTRGVILRSPNNNCWKLVVDNSGNLTSTSVSCP